MKPRILLLMLSVVLAATCLAAQQNVTPDSKQEGLAIWARFELLCDVTKSISEVA